MNSTAPSSRVDSIRRSLVNLKMPRALEILDATLRRIEQGQIDGIEALDELLGEELSLRENRRIKAALRMARLPVVKTLAGYDFSFQPSLDRNRILALAGLDFIERAEVVHLLGPPGTGKSHIATALAVEAVRAGKAVYFIPLADLIAQLAKAEREGTLREKIRFLTRASLLVVDEIGYLPVTPGGANLFFQLVNARYEKGAMILTSNRGFAEWGEVFGEPVVATRAARQAAPPCRRHPDRGLQLPHARACRTRPGKCPRRRRLQSAAAKTWPTPKERTSRSSIRLITAPSRTASIGNFKRPHLRKLRCPLTRLGPHRSQGLRAAAPSDRGADGCVQRWRRTARA
jgi:DNA replication protein DnaC